MVISLLTLSQLALATAEIAMPNNSTSTNHGIRLREDSNICISVNTDPAVWSHPVTTDTDRNLSGILGTALRGAMNQYRVAPTLSDNQTPRFVSELGGQNPLCSDSADIHIVIRYYPHENGTPFNVEWTIRQQESSIRQVFSRNIEAEWQTGELPRWANSHPLEDAVLQDLRERASSIAQQLISMEN